LIAQGATTLRPRQLEQLASQSTARGNDNPLRLAEVGALPCVTSPSAALDTHDAVIWGPLDAPALPAPWPWSKAEIATLLVAGCALPAYTALLQQAADAWLKPILVARKRLVLLLPPPDRESHPVWQLIEAMIPDIPVLSVEALLTDAMAKREVVSCTPLPAIKRWWHLPLGTHVPAVEAYSYSQLEKQLFNPYHWLLAHAARLRSGSLLSLADDFRLKGILAHSLVERLYAAAAGKDMADAAFAAWFDPAFDRLIAEEGALYLMPGRRTDLENLRLTLRRALIELRMLLRRAGVALVEAERNLSGQFVGGKLGGKSDLVLAKPDGESAIIDMKWGGKSHRPRLEDNRHLQLAIYAELLRQNTQRWPSVAYFLLSEATLLTRDGAWFPGVTPVLDKTGENTAQLWLRFLETWKWRQAQFAEGTFEVVLEPGDTPESQAPDTGLAAEVLNPAYNECLPLAGWGDLA
jgi:RecB family exonuclease